MNDLASDAVGLGLLLVAVVIVWRIATATIRTLRRKLAGAEPENVITNIVAAMCTAVAAQGMFRFFADQLEMPWWMQPLTFGVFELAQLAFALRARKNIRKTGHAGVDGALMWVMSAASAMLAATDSHGWAALARAMFPFAAAISWERGLSIERKERRRARPDEGVQSRLTVERLLVWLRLAEPVGRTASDVAVHRRLTRVAVTTQRLRTAPAGSWRAWFAGRRQAAAVRRAVEYADLATNPDRQAALLAQIGALSNAQALAEVRPPAPWDVPAGPRADRSKLRLVSRQELEEIEAGRDRTRVPDDVLPPIPRELAPLVKKGRRKFQGEIEAGKVPSIERLKKTFRVGQDRATAIQAYLAVPEGQCEA